MSTTSTIQEKVDDRIVPYMVSEENLFNVQWRTNGIIGQIYTHACPTGVSTTLVGHCVWKHQCYCHNIQYQLMS